MQLHCLYRWHSICLRKVLRIRMRQVSICLRLIEAARARCTAHLHRPIEACKIADLRLLAIHTLLRRVQPDTSRLRIMCSHRLFSRQPGTGLTASFPIRTCQLLFGLLPVRMSFRKVLRISGLVCYHHLRRSQITIATSLPRVRKEGRNRLLGWDEMSRRTRCFKGHLRSLRKVEVDRCRLSLGLRVDHICLDHRRQCSHL